jgi:cytochrome c oxidase subunit 1
MATQVEPFRTCPVTGLKVHLPAENLIKANAVAAVVFILIGGIFALLVALTRWPAVHLLPANLFYRFLTAHGVNMLIFWIIFFEIAGLYFGSAVLLNCRLAAPRLGWFAFILMVAGAILTDVIIMIGKADVMFTAYPPLKAHPLFYLGYILFAVGALIGCGLFFATLMIARAEGKYSSSLPLATFGLAVAAISAVVTIIGGATILIPTLLWALGIVQNIDPPTYRLVFWLFGHSSQQINVAAMVTVWYLLATLTVGAQPVSEAFSRTAFLLYALFINVASAHHLQVDPALSPAWKVWNTGYIMHLAVLASMMHALAVPASVEKAQRQKGYAQGLFEWLKKAPWGNPGFSALVFSLLLFGVLGGITGVVFGTEQLSIISHNTWRITGHFHGTVVAGTTLAFMGLTYYVIPLIFRRELMGKSLAMIQPYLFGIGVTLLSVGMMMSGSLGVPRRHWDVAGFGGSPFAFEFNPAIYPLLTMMGIGAILAVLGGAIYVGVTVGSVFFGKKVSSMPDSISFGTPAIAGGSDPVKDPPEKTGGFGEPGTFILAVTFLIVFIIYYFLNWKWLAGVWPVR